MRVLSIAAIAALAITAAAIAAPSRQSPAHGPGRSLSLVAVQQHCGGADLPPRDASPGDITICHGRLRHRASGVNAGTAAWFCPYTGTERAGSVCTAVASLRDGDLELAGRLSHTSARSTWAITGGTRRYAGAHGTAALNQLDDTHTAVTIRLGP
jgi:hypothetical protein